ncbi:hypothetical protein RhiirA1_442301 [Rhizophagus irregularis]|uniref:Uncharacterized protein n=1 Tax=Rhizophagus irregularis TaxID=588596 RepID=A0A2N0RQ49_9GLOM|nr:hypothetical protein RhiirA1_442301 [Rhizophagus irregularis]
MVTVAVRVHYLEIALAVAVNKILGADYLHVITVDNLYVEAMVAVVLLTIAVAVAVAVELEAVVAVVVDITHLIVCTCSSICHVKIMVVVDNIRIIIWVDLEKKPHILGVEIRNSGVLN